MEFTSQANLLKNDCDTLIVGVFKDGQLSPSAQTLDGATQNQISQTVHLSNFKGTPGSYVRVYNPNNISADRLFIVGLGAQDKLTIAEYKKACEAAAGALKNSNAEKVGVMLPEVNVKDMNLYAKVRAAIESMAAASYEFKTFKSPDKDDPQTTEPTLYFDVEEFNKSQVETAVEHGRAVARGMNLMRDLANTPPNICTPTYMADMAKQVAKDTHDIRVHVITEAEMRDLGMGAFLAVTQGSDEPARMVVMEYHGGDKNDKPIAIVGKGVTFDTGGISLKPSNVIANMKYDMSGAASVLGVMQMVAELKLPINVVGVMACTENMPSGCATRPDDVVTTMCGKTVEIANTDAEGRLILSDALTYTARHFEPTCMIDIATLTGACIVALGSPASGVMTNHQPLADEIMQAGHTVHDRAWQLPLWSDYDEQIKSVVADLCNIGTGGEAGSITAGSFLANFVEGVDWAHLDIASTAYKRGKDAASTGRPVPLLSQFILQRANVIPA